jgi:hypothetical protein
MDLVEEGRDLDLGEDEYLRDEAREPGVQHLRPVLGTSPERSDDPPTVRAETSRVGLWMPLGYVEPGDPAWENHTYLLPEQEVSSCLRLVIE